MSAKGAIWFPMGDTALQLQMSREQLQAAQDALLGQPEPVPGYFAYLANEIERVLQETIEGAGPVRPNTGDSPT